MQQFRVKGVNPLGRLVEFLLPAPSARDAKEIAEDTGLKFVVVKDASVEGTKNRPDARGGTTDA